MELRTNIGLEKLPRLLDIIKKKRIAIVLASTSAYHRNEHHKKEDTRTFRKREINEH